MHAAWLGRRAAPRIAWVAALAVVAGAGGTGCSRAQGPDIRNVAPAQEGITALVSALRSEDPAPAYALLAESVRQQVSVEEFAAHWATTAAERQDRARALEAELTSEAPLGERARVEYVGGKSVRLVREGGAWRIESALVSRAHPSQPRDAVQLFARALAERDYDALMRILSERRRERIGRQLGALVTSLNEHLDEGPDTLELIDEDRAELRWDDGEVRYRIILRKEGNQWRVDDVHLRPAPGATGELE